MKDKMVILTKSLENNTTIPETVDPITRLMVISLVL